MIIFLVYKRIVIVVVISSRYEQNVEMAPLFPKPQLGVTETDKGVEESWFYRIWKVECGMWNVEMGTGKLGGGSNPQASYSTCC
jgi:hypothetical protein